MQRGFKKLRLFVIIGVLCSASALYADILQLKNGQRLEGKVIGQSRTGVRIKMADGRVRTVNKSDIRRLQFAPVTDPAEQERKRQEAEKKRQEAEKKRLVEEERKAAAEREKQAEAERKRQEAADKIRIQEEARAREREAELQQKRAAEERQAELERQRREAEQRQHFFPDEHYLAFKTAAGMASHEHHLGKFLSTFKTSQMIGTRLLSSSEPPSYTQSSMEQQRRPRIGRLGLEYRYQDVQLELDYCRSNEILNYQTTNWRQGDRWNSGTYQDKHPLLEDQFASLGWRFWRSQDLDWTLHAGYMRSISQIQPKGIMLGQNTDSSSSQVAGGLWTPLYYRFNEKIQGPDGGLGWEYRLNDAWRIDLDLHYFKLSGTYSMD
ncbi:MAG: hypothetical protein KDK39_19270, partial [Leptospiraceae bacterium]|nr:hypothetical protein [Leptospiraceae bacterium]